MFHSAMVLQSACRAADSLQELTQDVESELSTELGSEHSESDHETGDCTLKVSNSFTTAETLIIFDWDDTLFPTTWLQREGCLEDESVPISTSQAAQLQLLSEHVKATLDLAKARAKVVIVTNAQEGWVDLSCSKFMPALQHSLRGVDVMSARSSFEQEHKHFEWKCLAFAKQVKDFYGTCPSGHRRNILSLGDSLHEQRALTSVTQCVPNCLAKSIKFMEKPEVQQLIDEHEILIGVLQDVIDDEGSLDLEVGTES